MKKLLVLILCIGLISSVSAQKFGFRGGYRFAYVPRVSVGVGYGYNPYWGFGYPYFGYPYYGYPYGYNGREPYRLAQVEDNIRYDYQQKIDAVRDDSTIHGKARREKIRALKHERDQAINDAEYNFYNRRNNRNYNNGNSNNNNGNNSSNNGNNGSNNGSTNSSYNSL